MKALETQYCELKEKIVAAEIAKGFSEAAIETTIKETCSGETIEERLGRLQKHAKKVGITESRRVQRKNGTAINEAGTEDRVQKYLKKGFTLRESYVMCNLPDPGPSAKQPAAFTESLVKAWKKYARVSESDARLLAEKGISPE